MPRTAITAQPISLAGVFPTFEAGNVDGHAFRSTGHRAVWVRNASAAAINVTFITPGTIDGDLPIPDRVVSVPATSDRLIAGLHSIYHQPNGNVHFDLSAVASVTVAVIDVP